MPLRRISLTAAVAFATAVLAGPTAPGGRAEEAPARPLGPDDVPVFDGIAVGGESSDTGRARDAALDSAVRLAFQKYAKDSNGAIGKADGRNARRHLKWASIESETVSPGYYRATVSVAFGPPKTPPEPPHQQPPTSPLMAAHGDRVVIIPVAMDRYGPSAWEANEAWSAVWLGGARPSGVPSTVAIGDDEDRRLASAQALAAFDPAAASAIARKYGGSRAAVVMLDRMRAAPRVIVWMQGEGGGSATSALIPAAPDAQVVAIEAARTAGWLLKNMFGGR